MIFQLRVLKPADETRKRKKEEMQLSVKANKEHKKMIKPLKKSSYKNNHYVARKTTIQGR